VQAYTWEEADGGRDERARLGKIIVILIVVAVATGLLLGLAGRLFGLLPGMTGAGAWLASAS